MSSLFDVFRRRRVRPTETVGAMGTSVYGGYVQTNERSPDLSGSRRFQTYSEVLANVSIVAAGVRYFLNVAGKAHWTMRASTADVDGRWAEFAERALFDAPDTPWSRVVRRAAMYRFHGFSVQEWTARRDGAEIVMADVAPRPQQTIERWDVDETGVVAGVVQRTPRTMREVYIPRGKVLYLVDDSLSDSPEGLGIFRHLVRPARALQALERLEGLGFETDLRGVPIGRGPFAALAEMVARGELKESDRQAIEAPMRDFIQNHLRAANSGILLDSATYRDLSDAARPTGTPQWTVELLKGQSTSLGELNTAIGRLNTEMARTMGVEQLLLGGGDSGGAYALSRDKSEAFFLTINGALVEIADAVTNDLLKPLWRLNGLDPELMPSVEPEEVNYSDVETITASLARMAQAGAVLSPDDPVVDEVRGLMGLSPQPSQADDDDLVIADPVMTEEDE